MALSDDDIAVLEIIARAGVLEPSLTGRDKIQTITKADVDMLNERQGADLVEVSPFIHCPRCPCCEGTLMTVSEECPGCGTADIDTVLLKHHIPCAGIFQQEKDEDRQAICPKCYADLSQEADRVEDVGEMYRCNRCDSKFPEPVLRFYCVECSKFNSLDSTQYCTLFKYRLTDVGFSLLAAAVNE